MSLSKSNRVHEVAIIGAGISGLSARLRLHELGVPSITLEKSRGLGGRMSTRRGDGWVADLGAQFTTRRSPEWKEILKRAEPGGAEIFLSTDSRYSRITHSAGMRSFAHAVSSSVEPNSIFPDASPLFLGTRVTRIAPAGSRWEITTESGDPFEARSLLVTLPIPQVRELLLGSDLSPSAPAAKILDTTFYSSSYSLVAALSEPLPETIPPVWKNPTARLDGIFDQRRKGVDTPVPTLVVHTSDEFTLQMWDYERDRIEKALLEELNRVLQEKGVIPRVEHILALHRWRYTEPRTILEADFLQIDGPDALFAWPPLFIAGDAFRHASVEGAFSSGRLAAAELNRTLGSQGR